MTGRADEVEIDALGARGDGIVELPEGPIFIPYALPGERWRVKEGEPSVLLRPHPARAKPVCRHFGSCGGCVAQHMPEDMYVAWKRAIMVDAFRHRGIDAPLEPLVRIPPASRRRVTLYARRYRKELYVGFYRAATHYILNVEECPVASPAIVRLLPVLREMLDPVLSGKAEAAISMLATPGGVDVAISFIHVGPLRQQYPRMAALAVRHGIARLTVEDDRVAQTHETMLTFGGVDVEPPPRSFVQAVAQSEEAMIRLVTGAAGKARRIADLFCGIGTFTFPLARQARVTAVDSREDAVAALAGAARRSQGLKPIETRVRDLFRTPLSAQELTGFDAVVLDPARSGAQKQAEQIARSRVPAVIYVSCEPGTLARDARTLLDGGYGLERVTPIDQFLYADHVEAVSVLRR